MAAKRSGQSAPTKRAVPGAISTHAQASQVEPLGIDGKSRSAVKKELIKPIRQFRPPCVPRTLRRDDDEREIGMLRYVRRQSVSQHAGWILPRLTKPMQEQDGRAFLIGAPWHLLRNIQQVVQSKFLRDPEVRSHNLHRMTSLPGSAPTRRLQWRLVLMHARIVRERCANGQVGFPKGAWLREPLSDEKRAHFRDGTDESPYRRNSLGSRRAPLRPGVVLCVPATYGPRTGRRSPSVEISPTPYTLRGQLQRCGCCKWSSR